ncbi:MAG: histidine--tRNA ligase [Deltaproteobacteria bacterium]|nr:MAG: histidine--tRNA ligase [Deltaproteobacteria bacterium]
MIQAIRGFRDILPGDVELWQVIEQEAIRVFTDFGFSEIRLPVLERTELFARSIGEETDIVQKEMYTFPDSKGKSITMRPEATASIVRSYIQHKMYAQDPVRKFYTIGPMFRRERPQKGRYRQFYQINAEVFGIASPYIDAQLIVMLTTLLDRLGITGLTAHINSLGCAECRPSYHTALKSLLAAAQDQLCTDCRHRSETNPLRVLDCKVPSCREALKEAPALIDRICQPCREHFEMVTKSLDNQGVAYEIDKQLVRGLDYYSRTAFEIQTDALGAQSAIAGGGRYDRLIKNLGGPEQPAIGFAIGFDRLAEVMSQMRTVSQRSPQLRILPLDDISREKAYDWSTRLCKQGICAEADFSGRGLKSLMKRADKTGASFVLIVGQAECEAGHAILRDMATKEQTEISIDILVESIAGRFAQGRGAKTHAL